MFPETNADRWSERIAARWASLLAAHRIDPTGIIVEVGPGFTTKVARALGACRFRGTVVLVEPNDAARQWSLDRYRALLPSCTVEGIPLPMDHAAGALPRHVDAILMNHVVDDCILYRAVAAERRPALFAGMCPDASCPDEVRRVWTSLAADARVFRAIADAVVGEMHAFCTNTHPALAIINQYQSWVHTHERLTFVDRLTAPLVRRLWTLLASSGAYDRVDLSDDDRWIVARSSTAGAMTHPAFACDRHGH